MAEQFDRQRFSGLELLPTSMLEEIIQTDFNAEASYSEEMIQYVLELIAKRREKEQPETLPNMHEAWKKLRLRANEEEGLNLSKELPVQTQKHSPREGKRIVRYVAVVAACLTLLFAMLITVQALGGNIFGSKGSWTEEHFRFEAAQDSTKTYTNSELVNNELGEALLELGIPTELAPTWIPEGYNLVQIEQSQTEQFNCVSIAYVTADKTDLLTVEIIKHHNSSSLTDTAYEKNPDAPEIHIHNGKHFYLFENCGRWTAAWGSAEYGITISGGISKITMLNIINSIQEVTNE